jgi:hypothetical protein
MTFNQKNRIVNVNKREKVLYVALGFFRGVVEALDDVRCRLATLYKSKYHKHTKQIWLQNPRHMKTLKNPKG